MSKIAVTVDFTLKQHAMFHKPKRILMIAIECFSGYYLIRSTASLEKMVILTKELRDAMLESVGNHKETDGYKFTCVVYWEEALLETLCQKKIVERLSKDQDCVEVRFLWNRE